VDCCAGCDLLRARSGILAGAAASQLQGQWRRSLRKYVVLGNVQVSQASNFAGDQLTYIDGTIEIAQSHHYLNDTPGRISQ